MEQKSIALDGPAGAGKSTLARRAAEHFGLIYVDTGALYRCIGLHALRNGINSSDEQGVAGLLHGISIEMKHDGDGLQRMLLCGEDVTDAIRSPESSKYASDVSPMPKVRDFLLSMQREMVVKYDAIMDGRDIGTVVLPNAGLKIFITADMEKRVQRRYLELKEKNSDTVLEEVREAMLLRDKKDRERTVAPLKAADDAVLLDTTLLNLDESFEALCEIISRRFGL
ncbi:MAG: (d)CMP kinase [Oscillospiraceae bacterium]|nr:(d)CMP kinase [Oscillospiraceae bacterium]